MGWNKSVIRGFDEGWNISGVGIPTATWIGANSTSTGSGTNTGTWGTVNIGTAAPTRRVFVAGGALSTGVSVSSVTIGGITATLSQNGTGETNQWIASAVVPTGTTASVVVVLSGTNFVSGALAVWTCDDSLLLSATPTSSPGYGNNTSSTSLAVSLTTAQNGFSLLYYYVFGTATTTTIASSDDSYVLDINNTTVVRGHCNGTTSRTSNITLNAAASTNMHCAIWNFR